MTMPVPLPFGLREVRVTPYTDFSATALQGSSIKLPNSRTFSFAEAEEFEELRGDDSLVATHGAGPVVNWELEAGGYSLEAAAAIIGGTVTTSGSNPNRIKRLRKLKTDQRPYFKVMGRAISDSGGDVHQVVWRCKATGDFSGEYSDGQFWLSGLSGVGLPCLIAGPDLDAVWDTLHNEALTALP